MAGIARNLARYGVVLLAEKVENQDMFKVCQRLGFTYFQGFFFSKPEIVPGRKLASGETTKIKLLKELASPDTNIDRLEQIIQTDLSILLPSAGQGSARPVDSAPAVLCHSACHGRRDDHDRAGQPSVGCWIG